MSRIARYLIEITEDLFADETAQDAASETRRTLVDGYYRSVRVVEVVEEEIPDDPADAE